MVILVMMVKYDDEDENAEEEQDGLDLLSLADFDNERGGGGELGCQGGGHQGGEESKTEHTEKNNFIFHFLFFVGAGHQGGEESKTEHSEQFQLLHSTRFRQWRTERSYQNTS